MPLYPQPLPLLGASAAILLLFTTIATVDGLYLHLWRYRLHRRPASRYEHRLHTANAVLFPPLSFLLFCVQPAGLWLWLAAALALVTLGIEIADVRCEHASRADLGGLGRNEYLMHFLMSALRSASVVPLLVSAPGEAWAPARTALGARPLWLLLTGAAIAVPAVGTALLHLWLCLPAGAARQP
jgi:hypothetical protein